MAWRPGFARCGARFRLPCRRFARNEGLPRTARTTPNGTCPRPNQPRADARRRSQGRATRSTTKRGAGRGCRASPDRGRGPTKGAVRRCPTPRGPLGTIPAAGSPIGRTPKAEARRSHPKPPRKEVRERWRCTTRWWRQALPKRGAAKQGQEHGESCHENPPHRGVVRTRFARAQRPGPFVPAASGHVRGTCLRPACRAEVFSRRR